MTLPFLFAAPSMTPASPLDSQTLTAQDNYATGIQTLAFNYIHGQMEPPSEDKTSYYNWLHKPFQAEAGGAKYLATDTHELRVTNPNTPVVSAGDNAGAIALLSASFHD
jgi:2',3'-cyclic-nucleotide 2'-phosphodiesterase (5'-nucleotidase family)